MMTLLKATYNIGLPNRLRVKYPDNEQLYYSTRIDEFQAEVTLIIDEDAGSSVDINDVLPTRYAREMKIVISRDLDSEPPRPQITEHGRALSMVHPWFDKNTKEYKEAAVTTANRVVKFFRYKMSCPFLYEYSGHEREFGNPEWTNSNGEIFDPGTRYDVFTINNASLGENDFTITQAGDLLYALENDLPDDTSKEFLADAQTSILSGKLVRGIIELAIACEVATKSTYAKQQGPLRKVRRIIEGREWCKFIRLLDEFAKMTFRESFKDIAPTEYNHIDYLFKTRNKAAHLGGYIMKLVIRGRMWITK